MNGVTAVTLTRYRPVEVQRAMRSVRAQQAGVPVEHLVLIDDNPEIEAALAPVAGDFPDCTVRYVPREPDEVSGPGRASRLRNLGVQLAAHPWVAFLDDDNEWTPDHLASLLELAERTGSRAVYCEVALLTVAGEPYLEPRWPWAGSREEAEESYRRCVERGVCVPGSNVIHDRPDVHDVPVDSSAWLLRRDLLLEVPFTERFSATDARDLISEDDKLFHELRQRGERLACTGKPTLRYYLGGYSNSHETVHRPEDIAWASE